MVRETPPTLTEVQCAFCGGKGRDRFGIMSALSTCSVCGGTGTVSVNTPYVRCAFCHGTGVYPHSRQSCTACDGAGVSPVHERNKTCPYCQGTGADPHSEVGFYCPICHGRGVIDEADSLSRNFRWRGKVRYVGKLHIRDREE